MGLLCKIERFVLTVLYFVHVARTEVPEYCLQPLNTNDCGLSPVTVVTYWKPGSRCEIDTWRGCPTVNMFPDEYNCSSTCIFKPSTPSECEATLNENKCSDVEETVYTFVNGICVPKKWRGCESLNKFTNQTECMETCSDAQWQGKLETLDVGELKDISELLDTVIQGHNRTSIPLYLHKLGAADDTQDSPEDSNTEEDEENKTDDDSEEANGSDDNKENGDSEKAEKGNDENDNDALAAKDTSQDKQDDEVDISEEPVISA